MRSVLTGKCVTIVARPNGYPIPTDFAIVSREVTPPARGEVLVRTLWLSLDPYQRGRMNDARSYASPLQLGDPMPGGVVGRVLASEAPGLSPGDLVEGLLSWSELHCCSVTELRRLDPEQAPLSSALGLLGIPGLSAWFGLMELGRPRPGDTVVVSAAAGGVGQVVGQLAKLAGCRVIGIAGAQEKLAYVTDALGYDGALNYRNDDLATGLAELCPKGVDIYFDNVGGVVSETVFAHLAQHARIVVCGRMSQTNRSIPDLGPRDFGFLTVKEATMEGFLLRRFAPRFDEGRTRLADLLRAGRLQYREDVVHGLENAPEAFIGLLKGAHLGKVLVQLDRRS